MSFKINLSDKVKAERGISRGESQEDDRGPGKAAKLKLLEGDPDSDEDAQPSAGGQHVPQGAKRLFAGKPRSTVSGPGTLPQAPNQLGPQSNNSWASGPRGQGSNIYTSVVAKVSNLPPDIDEDTIAKLFDDYPSLKVTRVERLPSYGRGQGRPSVSMRVTFGQGATAAILNNAIADMSDKRYLGSGYFLHLDRYLGASGGKEPEKLPFGAQWIAPEVNKFAPSAELGGDRREQRERKIITAYPPADRKTLQLVHQTIEGVLSGGSEFEAALMNQEDVKKDIKYAWLYDTTHPLHRYYRFRMHQLISGNHDTVIEIYSGLGEWHGVAPIQDEFAYHLGSLDEEMDELRQDPEAELSRSRKTADAYPGMVENANGLLTPKSRAFLLFLLGGLPLRKRPTLNSDIAAVTAFAIDKAAQGMDDIVDILIDNIFQPVAMTPINVEFRVQDSTAEDTTKDHIEAIMNALRCISDLAGVAHRLGGRYSKYREALGTQLLERHVFEYLGQAKVRLNMSRLVALEYRKAINFVIAAWKGEALFTPDTTAYFDQTFNAVEKAEVAAKKKREAADLAKTKERGTVDERGSGPVFIEKQHTPRNSTEQATKEDVKDEKPGSESATSQTPKKRDDRDEATVAGSGGRARRNRPKAEDMFASDED
ncbi:hypothetical protein M011DRAFT_407241 [Sporormia fimetaria CBS 119925]|uniref:SURP motif domain-containing protein n=1 Tax=Sporormia fimetaria CBS 119925 TaxID=1340428 RepID=A0A6A6V6J7_9PLEO|nr:hypothetical protein M011DRAFT_407241 [Sporormia fimetaria CBS 119925]